MVTRDRLAVLVGAVVLVAAAWVAMTMVLFTVAGAEELPVQEAAAYDVGPGWDGVWCEYATLEDLTVAMTNPDVMPCGAIHWVPGGDQPGDLPSYWAGPGYDPAYLGYAMDTEGFDGLPSWQSGPRLVPVGRIGNVELKGHRRGKGSCPKCGRHKAK